MRSDRRPGTRGRPDVEKLETLRQSLSDMESVLEALRCLNADYQRHAHAARRLAEEYFEASTVVGRMLDDAGFR